MIELPKRKPRKTTETNIVYACIVALDRVRGVRAARNNNGSIKDVRGIPVTFGLGEGSPDIVGLITFGGVESAFPAYRAAPPWAFAWGLEVKKPGKKPTREQRVWANVAQRRGMRVGWADNVDDALAFITDVRDELDCFYRAYLACGVQSFETASRVPQGRP